MKRKRERRGRMIWGIPDSCRPPRRTAGSQKPAFPAAPQELSLQGKGGPQPRTLRAGGPEYSRPSEHSVHPVEWHAQAPIPNAATCFYSDVSSGPSFGLWTYFLLSHCMNINSLNPFNSKKVLDERSLLFHLFSTVASKLPMPETRGEASKCLIVI